LSLRTARHAEPLDRNWCAGNPEPHPLDRLQVIPHSPFRIDLFAFRSFRIPHSAFRIHQFACDRV